MNISHNSMAWRAEESELDIFFYYPISPVPAIDVEPTSNRILTSI